MLAACTGTPEARDSGGSASGRGSAPNILVIVTDDIGIDKTSAYGEHPQPAAMPTITALAERGVLFRNAYGNPTCSPSRASLLTGRHPSRTGVGRWIYPPTDTDHLEPWEVTIPELLRLSPHGYSSAAAGKWHLVTFTRDDPAAHPQEQGFAHHGGSLANPLDAVQTGNTPRSYWNWEKNVDGVPVWSESYMTTDTTDTALALQQALPEPWFLWVAYNDAHDPLHVPPADITTSDVSEDSADADLFDAMAQAADTELGRLLAGIPADVLANTVIVYVSDNGTPEHSIRSPWDPSRCKHTVYEGGVNVPMIIAGPPVSQAGSQSDALVHFVDLLPTVAELAEVDLGDVVDPDGQPVRFDGHSLVPTIEDPSAPSPRGVLYTEGFYPNGDRDRDWHKRMVRDQDWKLIRQEDQGGTVIESFFAMVPGAFDEGQALSEDQLDDEGLAAKARLQGELDAVVADLAYGH